MILYNLSNYDILPDGTVIDLTTNTCLPLIPREDGYIQLSLKTDEGTSQKFYLHRLVATAFIPNFQNLPCVNHKDENKLNNSVENLEWCSYQYNINYGTRTERAQQTKAEKGFTVPKTAIKIVMKDKKTGEILKTYNSVKEAGRDLGVSPSHINEVVHGKRKSAYGYLWEAAE